MVDLTEDRIKQATGFLWQEFLSIMNNNEKGTQNL
jgi:hypothetical protein